MIETAEITQQPSVRRPKIIGNLSKLRVAAQEAKASTPTPVAPQAPANDRAGILILALGHPFYGDMAANLAMSLKFSGCPKIHLVYHGNALSRLSEQKLAFFDSMSECPQEAIMKNGKVAYFKAKTWMYELSPFQETLFLDADMIWFGNRGRNVHTLIESLKGVEWTIQNRERFDLAKPEVNPKWMWGSVPELREKHKVGYLYSLHSELVWFKRSDRVKAYFEKVKEIFDNPPITANAFAGDIADEFAFAMACLQLDMHPHETPFLPVYWYKLDARHGTEISRLKEKFYAWSAGGNNMSPLEIRKYETMVNGYAYQMRIPGKFKLHKKLTYLRERVDL